MKFQDFLKEFIPQVAGKTKQVNKAVWILETTGLDDAADLKAELDTELRVMFNDPAIYQKLLAWDKEPHDPLTKRELNVLIRAFKPNQVPKKLLEELSKKEALLGQTYANFRPQLEGKPLTENEIKEILKNENDPERRKKAWEASKQIGPVLAPPILTLVKLRNECAKSLGYDNYFEMQLSLQEVDPKWLLKTFDALAQKSDRAYAKVLQEIEEKQKERFHAQELGPWAWSEPFCQEDPLDAKELDSLTEGIDIPKACASFYQEMGIGVGPVLAKSDLFEREGKCQHAFCMNIDREKDVRTLNNVRASIRWLETVLHELGHAIYELEFDPTLPWLLKEPPHMITTEAMALIAGRQAYRPASLKSLVDSKNEPLFQKAEKSLRRRQLIFSRWVLVMSAFESELYRDPSQNLNELWWSLVEKYQKIKRPNAREKEFDWATKYHIGLAPVYYFSYLLGECFASSIQEALVRETGSANLNHPKAGRFLTQKIFHPGNRMRWDELVQYATGAPLTPDAWVKEFAT